MKRTAVVVGTEVFAVANPAPRVGAPVWLFVRLDTDAGISGYGEIFTSSLFTRPLTTARIVAEFVDDFVIGRRTAERELIYLSAYNSHYSHAGDMLKTAIMSGADIALWDFAGNRLDQMVEIVEHSMRERVSGRARKEEG